MPPPMCIPHRHRSLERKHAFQKNELPTAVVALYLRLSS
jgi:hypothetical protein